MKTFKPVTLALASLLVVNVAVAESEQSNVLTVPLVEYVDNEIQVVKDRIAESPKRQAQLAQRINEACHARETVSLELCARRQAALKSEVRRLEFHRYELRQLMELNTIANRLNSSPSIKSSQRKTGSLGEQSYKQILSGPARAALDLESPNWAARKQLPEERVSGGSFRSGNSGRISAEHAYEKEELR